MRLLALAILAVCLLLAGYAAATLRTSDTTTAQTTWHFESYISVDELRQLMAEMPAGCMVDYEERSSDGYSVAYSCPD